MTEKRNIPMGRWTRSEENKLTYNPTVPLFDEELAAAILQSDDPEVSLFFRKLIGMLPGEEVHEFYKKLSNGEIVSSRGNESDQDTNGETQRFLQIKGWFAQTITRFLGR